MLLVLDDDHSQGGNAEREAGGSSLIHPSDSWLSEEKGWSQSSLSTSTSVASSEAGWDPRSPLDNSNINRLSIQMPHLPLGERTPDPKNPSGSQPTEVPQPLSPVKSDRTIKR